MILFFPDGNAFILWTRIAGPPSPDTRMTDASPFLVWTFAALGVLVGAAFPLGVYWASRRLGKGPGMAVAAAAGTALWLALTAGAAAGVPLAALVGVQAFRFPLELAMHRAYEEGLMPVQMSYSGRNFDIVTGVTAILVAGLLLAGRMPAWGVRLWNWMGLALLVNIVVIANLSTPTPFRVFMNEPANVWISRAPFVWLPAVMVLTALLGHIVVLRRLRLKEQPAHAETQSRRKEMASV
jgi:hypothetical protein